MKAAPEFLYNPAYSWLQMARVIEHKIRQTMNHFFYTPTVRVSNRTKPAGFWDLFNEGIIALEEQNQEEFQSISGLKNQDSNVLKNRIDAYCEAHDIREIPTIAKVKAIMFLDIKFKQISHDITSVDQVKNLKTFYPRESYDSLTNELTRFQNDFAINIKKEIIQENQSISSLNSEQNLSTEYKVRQLESMKLTKTEDTRQTKILVIQLYYYYLSRYQEFLTKCIISDNDEQEQNNICYSDSSSRAKRSDDQIEGYLDIFRNDVAQRKVVNYPETIYDLVVKCKKELDTIKAEVGMNHESYLRSSTNVVHLTTTTLFEMIEHPVSEILLAPIEGLKLGNNLIEECDVAFNEINKIEMDSISLRGFIERKKYFELLKQQI